MWIVAAMAAAAPGGGAGLVAPAFSSAGLPLLRLLRVSAAGAPVPVPAAVSSCGGGASLPPPAVGCTRVVSWNALAQVYVRSTWFGWSPRPCLKQARRWKQMHAIIDGLRADVLLMQEVDEYEAVHRPFLEQLGFDGVYLQRPGSKRDGCLVAFRRDAWELAAPPVEVQLNAIAERDGDERLKRDNVALAVHLRSRPPSRSAVFATTHLFWDPAMPDVKLAQARAVATAVLETARNAGVPCAVLGADLNSTPDSDVVCEFTERCGFADALREARLLRGADDEIVTNVTPTFTAAIDHVLVHGKGAAVDAWLDLPGAAHPDTSGGLPNLLYPSDHLPVVVDIALPAS